MTDDGAPEARFRAELRVILERCRRMSASREITVQSNGTRIAIRPELPTAALDAFASDAVPSFVHVTNLGRPNERGQIRWVDLRYAIFRRTLHTLIGLVCTSLPAGELKNRLYRLLGMRIGAGVEISQGAFLDPFSPALITVGDGTVIGAFAKIFTHVYRGRGRMLFGPVVIGRDCVISGTATVGPCILEDNVTLLPGVVTLRFLRLRSGSVAGLRFHLEEFRDQMHEVEIPE